MQNVLKFLMQQDMNVMTNFEKVLKETINLPKIIDDLISTMFESKSIILE